MRGEILLRAKGFMAETLLDPLPTGLTPKKTEGPYRELAKALALRGFGLRTKNTLTTRPVAEVHVNVQPGPPKANAFLLRMESGFVVPENDDVRLLKQYAEVFTWDTELANRHGFHWLAHPQDPPQSNQAQQAQWLSFTERPISFCLFAANKSMRGATATDLYPERQRVIEWFEANAPSEFQLYGRHWDLPMASRSVSGAFQRALGKAGLLKQGLAVYRGSVPDKAPILRQAKFSFALENAEGLSGYLSEKLFDCLYEGCLPIYLGDPRVKAILPPMAYIPYLRGESLPELYTRLMNMTEAEYADRQATIADFLRSEPCKALSSDGFGESVAEVIVNFLDRHRLANG